MRRWRKTAVWLLTAALASSAAACSGSITDGAAVGAAADAGSGEEKDGKDTSEWKVGVCIYKFDDDFMALYREALKNCLVNEHGILTANIMIADSHGNQEEQFGQVERLIAQEVDVLIVNLVQASEAGAIADRCRDAGIPVVFINGDPGEEEIGRWEREDMAASYVGADGRLSGIYQGEIVLETPVQGDFDGDGTISYAMITGDPESVDTQERTKYSIETLEAAGMRTEKLFEQSGGWEQEKGKEAAQAALARYGRKIEVIFCNNDAMALGAREAILEAGRTVGRDICLVGVDALEDAIRCIKEGTMTGTVLNDHVSQAGKAAEAAVKMIRGEEVDRRYLVDYVKIAVDPAMAAAIADAGKPKSIFDTATGAREFTAGIAIHEFRDNFMTLYRAELETYLTDTYQAAVTVTDGAGSQQEQRGQIEAFIAQGVDVLIVNLVQASAAAEIVNLCQEAGVPAVLINCEPEETEIERWAGEGLTASYVGIGPGQVGTGWNDYEGQAHLAADVAAQMAAGRTVLTQYRVEFAK